MVTGNHSSSNVFSTVLIREYSPKSYCKSFCLDGNVDSFQINAIWAQFLFMLVFQIFVYGCNLGLKHISEIKSMASVIYF